MSQAPHAVQMRPGVKMGNTFLTDLMIYDGLTCGIRGIHMGKIVVTFFGNRISSVL
jgi:acetyl-CoA C-acetyltransferase